MFQLKKKMVIGYFFKKNICLALPKKTNKPPMQQQQQSCLIWPFGKYSKSRENKSLQWTIVHDPDYVSYWRSNHLDVKYIQQRKRYPEFEKLLLSCFVPKATTTTIGTGPKTYSNSVGRGDVVDPSPKHNAIQTLFLSVDFQRAAVRAVLQLDSSIDIQLEREEFECRNGSDVRLSGTIDLYNSSNSGNGKKFNLYFQIKPSVGEEFPGHHRQMKQERDVLESTAYSNNNKNKKESSALVRFVLFTREYRLQSTTVSQLKQYFASEDFVVLTVGDVESILTKTTVPKSTPAVVVAATVNNEDTEMWDEWCKSFEQKKKENYDNNASETQTYSKHRFMSDRQKDPSAFECTHPLSIDRMTVRTTETSAASFRKKKRFKL